MWRYVVKPSFDFKAFKERCSYCELFTYIGSFSSSVFKYSLILNEDIPVVDCYFNIKFRRKSGQVLCV